MTQDSLAELALYREKLASEAGPYTQERAEQLASDLQALGQKLRTNVADGGERAAEYGQELKSVMEQTASDISSTFSTYARKIRKRVHKDAEQFNK